ncbi:MAG: hypothetical protein ABL962_04380 [Fimbriimonadaceae bacterium]
MWFEKEMEAARKAVEKVVRERIGTRTIVAIGVVVLLGGVVIANASTVAAIPTWVQSILNNRLVQAEANVVQALTGDFFVRAISTNPKLDDSLANIRQTASFARDRCELQVVADEVVIYNGDVLKNYKVRDESVRSIAKLGDLESIEYEAGVDHQDIANTTTFAQTPGAYVMDLYAPFGTKGVRITVTDRETGVVGEDFPSYKLGELNFMPKVDARATIDDLLYLDSWCGNRRAVEVEFFEGD